MHPVSRTQKVLLAALGLLICLPAPLRSLTTGRPDLPPSWDWVANRSLAGVTLPQTSVAWSPSSWLSGKYQSSVTSWFNETFGAREWCIRLNNQLLYSLFRTTTMNGGKLVIGRNDTLFEDSYLLNYGRWAPEPEDARLEQMAVSARRVRDLLAARGVPFLILLTPSKAEFQPDAIPARFLRRLGPQPPPLAIDRFVAALQRQEMEFVDGRSLTRSAQASLARPVFSGTGTHWSKPAAYFTLRALLEKLGQLGGRPWPALEMSAPQPSPVSVGGDDDLAKLLNLVWEPNSGDYLQASYATRTTSTPPAPLTFVGGSFLWTMLDILKDASYPDGTRTYYYYKLGKFVEPERKRAEVEEARIPWLNDFASAGGVVLEINQAAFGGGHASAFLAAATAQLAALESGGSAAGNERLTFGKGGNAKEAVKRGFTPQTEDGFTWTDAREAEVELEVGSWLGQPIELRARVRPLLGEGMVERKVRVLVQDQVVGEWTMTNPDFAEYRCLIPPAAVGNQRRIRVTFVTEPTKAPGADTRKLGLAFQSLEWSSPARTSGDDRIDLTFGQGGSAAAAIRRGFTPLTESGFTWTDGRDAELEIDWTGPRVQGLDLEVELRPLLAPNESGKAVEVVLNGKPLPAWKVTNPAFGVYRLHVPPESVPPAGPLRLRLSADLTQAPGTDTRKLGLAFRRISLSAPGRAAAGVPQNGTETRLTFGKGGSAAPLAGRGFTPPTEDGFTWTDQREAEITVPLPKERAGAQDLTIAVQARPLLSASLKERRVEILADGRKVAEWTMTKPDFADYTLQLPAALVQGRSEIKLTFVSDPIQAPGTDTRRIALAFRTLVAR